MMETAWKYKPYPEYKDSGIEWLGEIPKDWKRSRLKHVARFEYGDSLPEEIRIPGGVNVFGSNGVVGEHDKPNTSGPCIIIGRKGSFGKIAYSPVPCFAIDTTYYVNLKGTENDLRWLYYCLQCLRLDSISKDSAVPGLAREEAYANIVPCCSFQEQRTIASFLDRETDRIDELIAKKEKLIALLEEKRSALISHAVTKGLNPDAKMKDSGIEWLGEIPAHWEVKRLRFLSANGLVNGLFKKKEFFGTGIKLINVFDIYRKDFLVDMESLERVDADNIEQNKYSVKSGDIFFVRSSLKLEGVGRSVCAFEVFEPTVFECHVVRARPKQDIISPVFLINYLNSSIAKHRLVSLSNLVTMATIDQEKIKSLEIALPPLSEQFEIINYIENENKILDSLICKNQIVIEKLQEYRTALISAAVTGKIDVRDCAEH